MKHLFTRIILLALPILPAYISSAQADTVSMSVPAAEKIFLQNNLVLLANRYNINISEALLQQAKAWDNPTLLTDQNLYDGKYFRHKTENGQSYGQVYIQLQQLVRTAGKIRKQTTLAQDNLASAEALFAETMRNLRYVLTTDMNTLGYLQAVAEVYNSEIESAKLLVKGMDAMLKAGDVSQKEDARIKALLFSLENEQAANLSQQIQLQEELALLLHPGSNTWIKSEAREMISRLPGIPLTALQDSALAIRADLTAAQSQALFQLHNIDYQKALAKPDLTIGIEYDKQNSYVPNYYGLTLAVPIPAFNRNRGNITAAEYSYRQSDVAVKELKAQVRTEVWEAWQKLLNATSILSANDSLVGNNYESLMKNMFTSYRQRQVNLVEFIDFFDAYRDTRIKQLQLVLDQRNAAAKLNYATNQNIIQL